MNRLRDFFYYSKQEQIGVLSLLVILLLVIGGAYCFDNYNQVDKALLADWEFDVAAFEQGLSVHQTEERASKQYYNYKAPPKKPFGIEKIEPFPFDPNITSREDFEMMGLPEKTIKSILNYRAKGGVFKTKEALQKIYTLSDQHYQALYPHIRLDKKYNSQPQPIKEEKILPPPFDFDPNTASIDTLEQLGLETNTIRSILNYRKKGGRFRTKEDFKKIYTLPAATYAHLEANIKIVRIPKFNPKPKYTPKAYYKIDINRAEIKDFQQFKGIGPAFAKRILKMRKGLGGFVTIKQIKEVYLLPDSTFQLMQPYLECDQQAIQPININTASVEALKAHPYLNWYQAKAIVQYREENGHWKSVDLIQILSELDDGKQTFQKIRPYLSVE